MNFVAADGIEQIFFIFTSERRLEKTKYNEQQESLKVKRTESRTFIKIQTARTGNKLYETSK